MHLGIFHLNTFILCPGVHFSKQLRPLEREAPSIMYISKCKALLKWLYVLFSNTMFYFPFYCNGLHQNHAHLHV